MHETERDEKRPELPPVASFLNTSMEIQQAARNVLDILSQLDPTDAYTVLVSVVANCSLLCDKPEVYVEQLAQNSISTYQMILQQVMDERSSASIN